jgi:hypothetical protein
MVATITPTPTAAPITTMERVVPHILATAKLCWSSLAYWLLIHTRDEQDGEMCGMYYRDNQLSHYKVSVPPEYLPYLPSLGS